MADDLAAWLLVQIGEDEQRINGPEARQWHEGGCHAWMSAANRPCTCGATERLLAECDAKRRIVQQVEPCPRCLAAERCVPHDASASSPHMGIWRGKTGKDDRIARALALPYADRPGYQESWRP